MRSILLLEELDRRDVLTDKEREDLLAIIENAKRVSLIEKELMNAIDISRHEKVKLLTKPYANGISTMVNLEDHQ